VVNIISLPLYALERILVPVKEEAGWTSETDLCTGFRCGNVLERDWMIILKWILGKLP
jgi:hypothetical protein